MRWLDCDESGGGEGCGDGGSGECCREDCGKGEVTVRLGAAGAGASRACATLTTEASVALRLSKCHSADCSRLPIR